MRALKEHRRRAARLVARNSDDQACVRPADAVSAEPAPAASARRLTEALRIEPDIDDVFVDQAGGAGHLERQVFLDGRELHIAVAVRDRDRHPVELGEDGLGLRPFVNHREADRQFDLARPAGRTKDDPALDADPHRQGLAVELALARGLAETGLIAQVHGGIVRRIRRDGQRRGAAADVHAGALEIRRRCRPSSCRSLRSWPMQRRTRSSTPAC